MRKSNGRCLSSARRALTTSDSPRRVRWTGTVKAVEGRREDRDRRELTKRTLTSLMSAKSTAPLPSLPRSIAGEGKAADRAMSMS